MTNYERIKSMTLDEMHSFLVRFEDGDIDTSKTFCYLCAKDSALNKQSCDCDGCLKWWLEIDSKQHPQGLDYWNESR